MRAFGNLFLGAIPVELDHFAGSREIFPKTVSLIYSEKIYSGVLPIALTLEEMGYCNVDSGIFQ